MSKTKSIDTKIMKQAYDKTVKRLAKRKVTIDNYGLFAVGFMTGRNYERKKSKLTAGTDTNTKHQQEDEK